MLANGQPRAVHDLLMSLWQEAGLAEPNVLDVYIHSLRAKLIAAASSLDVQINATGDCSLRQVEGAD